METDCLLDIHDTIIINDYLNAETTRGYLQGVEWYIECNKNSQL